MLAVFPLVVEQLINEYAQSLLTCVTCTHLLEFDGQKWTKSELHGTGPSDSRLWQFAHLMNGKIIVCKKDEWFEVVQNSWRRVDFTPPPTRNYATCMTNPYIMASGGIRLRKNAVPLEDCMFGFIRDCHLSGYDFAPWSYSLPQGVFGHQMQYVNNRVFVFAGFSSHQQQTFSMNVWAFDFDINQWIIRTPLRIVFSPGIKTSCVVGERIFVFGRTVCFIYDTVNDFWRQTVCPWEAYMTPQQSAFFNDQIYLFGFAKAQHNNRLSPNTLIWSHFDDCSISNCPIVVI